MADYTFLYDEREHSDDEVRAGYQALIDSGTAWRMEGSVGRSAMGMLEAGWCILGEVGHKDYWGNYVPSRTEVQAGTLGSIEYARNLHPDLWPE